MQEESFEEIEKGDAVKVLVDKYTCEDFKKGSVLFVRRVIHRGVWCISNYYNEFGRFFYFDELELLCKAPKFKKGDIVKCVQGALYDYGDLMRDRMYKILDLQYDEETNDFYVRIFDDEEACGWRANRFVPVGFSNVSEKRSQDAESNDEEDCIIDNENKPEDENIFKIGLSDTVKVWWGSERGKTGVIIAEDGDGYFNVKFSDGYTFWYPIEYLDLVEKYNGNTEKNLSETLQNALGGVPVINAQGGVKNDGGKIDYTLLLKDLPGSVKSVVKVLELGCKRYGRTNYSKVESERYEKSVLRHIMSHLSGDLIDKDSGEPHLSHAICGLLFLVEVIQKDTVRRSK